MQIKDKKIVLDKELNELDKFVLDFVDILLRHNIDYVIVSGYVSILFGRARSTEDIDIIVQKIGKTAFFEFLDDLKKSNFWCINVEDRDDMYDMYLCSDLAVRFAYRNEIIPNIELKFQKTRTERIALDNKVVVCLGNREIFISPIGLQIAFKRYVLKSDKDIEDALHLKKVFDITSDKIEEYRNVLED